jgi:hypothetical protein
MYVYGRCKNRQCHVVTWFRYHHGSKYPEFRTNRPGRLISVIHSLVKFGGLGLGLGLMLRRGVPASRTASMGEQQVTRRGWVRD